MNTVVLSDIAEEIRDLLESSEADLAAVIAEEPSEETPERLLGFMQHSYFMLGVQAHYRDAEHFMHLFLWTKISLGLDDKAVLPFMMDDKISREKLASLSKEAARALFIECLADHMAANLIDAEEVLTAKRPAGVLSPVPRRKDLN